MVIDDIDNLKEVKVIETLKALPNQMMKYYYHKAFLTAPLEDHCDRPMIYNFAIYSNMYFFIQHDFIGN